jgi:hypothetical protein
MEFCEALRELIQKYDDKRKLWIELYQSDKGFDEWFTNKVMPLNKKEGA